MFLSDGSVGRSYQRTYGLPLRLQVGLHNRTKVFADLVDVPIDLLSLDVLVLLTGHNVYQTVFLVPHARSPVAKQKILQGLADIRTSRWLKSTAPPSRVPSIACQAQKPRCRAPCYVALDLPLRC